MMKSLIVFVCLIFSLPSFAQNESNISERVRLALNRISTYAEALPKQPWHDEDLFKTGALLTAGSLVMVVGGAVGYYFLEPEVGQASEMIEAVRRGSKVVASFGIVGGAVGLTAIAVEGTLAIIDSYRGFDVSPRRVSHRLMYGPGGTKILVRLTQSEEGRNQLTKLALADAKFYNYLTRFARLDVE